jgi:hypothetical protein
MKVSRKVGRRSRSSVSRRRLRNKNRKHTKTIKRGKHGKRGRGHKRVRTHKHGRRFHRGGKFMTFFTKPTAFQTMGTADKLTGKIKNLRYTKITPGQDPSARFDDFDIIVNPTQEGITIVFSRPRSENDRPLEFIFGPSSNIESAIDKMNESFNLQSQIRNSIPENDNAFYILISPNESIVSEIVQYVRTKHYGTTLASNTQTMEQFFSSKRAQESAARGD